MAAGQQEEGSQRCDGGAQSGQASWGSSGAQQHPAAGSPAAPDRAWHRSRRPARANPQSVQAVGEAQGSTTPRARVYQRPAQLRRPRATLCIHQSPPARRQRAPSSRPAAQACRPTPPPRGLSGRVQRQRHDRLSAPRAVSGRQGLQGGCQRVLRHSSGGRAAHQDWPCARQRRAVSAPAGCISCAGWHTGPARASAAMWSS